ncbi:hypothetical protein LINGRAHAP2_LOCUS7431 [Linum grandiflorum]
MKDRGKLGVVLGSSRDQYHLAWRPRCRLRGIVELTMKSLASMTSLIARSTNGGTERDELLFLYELSLHYGILTVLHPNPSIKISFTKFLIYP